MLCKTEWSWELRTWLHKMNLLDILLTFPHHFCRKWIGATNENSNFDLRVVLNLGDWFILALYWSRHNYNQPALDLQWSFIQLCAQCHGLWKEARLIKGDLELLQTFLLSRACSEDENNTISYDMRFAHSRSRFVTKQGHFQPCFYSEPGH